MTIVGISTSGTGSDPLSRWKWTKAATAFADEWGPRILAGLRAGAPVGKGPGAGTLRDRLRYQRTTGVGSLTMLFDDPGVHYFPFVIHGTAGGTIIRPVAARALHWGGSPGIFATRVVRGATRENDFPSRVWASMSGAVAAGFRQAIQEGFE